MNIEEAVAIATPVFSKGFGTCSFGGVGDKYHRPCHQEICHAEGKRGWSQSIEFYYTSVAHEKTDQRGLEKLIEYTNWLLSDIGPWRNLVKGRQNKIIVADRRVGYVLEVKPDDDLCWLMNISIAGRMPHEYLACWELVKDLTDMGVSWEDAHYLAAFFSKTNNGLLSDYGHATTGHSIISESKWFNYKRFVEGDPRSSDTKLGGGNIGYGYGGGGGPIQQSFNFRQSQPVKNILNAVQESGAIVGRWTKVPGGRNIDSLVKAWNDNYKTELLDICAKAA